MASRVELNFSQTFEGTVWRTMAVPESPILILEIRNDMLRKTTFSALDFQSNKFLWSNVSFPERWWIGLTAATRDVLLLHFFHGTDNPDDKGIIAWHIYDKKVLWTRDHFSFSIFYDGCVCGETISDLERETVTLDIFSGKICGKPTHAPAFMENIMLRKPFQYIDGNVHFETVKSFLTSRLKIMPIMAVEYLEFENLIFISYYVMQESLAGYLVIYTHSGELIRHEKLDEHLKGMGIDTFFILSGSLFFVKNKTELISYRIV